MEFENKKLRDVAEIARQIMVGEELKGGQKKIDKNHNGKIDGQDFAILRGQKKPVAEAKYEDSKEDKMEDEKGKKETDMSDAEYEKSAKDKKEDKESKEKMKEEVSKPDFIDLDKDGNKKEPMKKAASDKKMKEEIDQAAEFVLEYESKDGKFVHRAKPGVYGGTKDEKHAVDTLKGPKMKELSDIEAEKKKKKKMSEMVATYQEQGLKGLFASLVKEEPDNEQFTKEVEAQKEKNAGQGKKAEVAKPSVQAVQNEEFEVVMDELNGYAEATIEERKMTEPEMKKKEEIVKSMKKGISGFKARYGDRAKNVMYATATKQAMKD